MNRPIGLDSAVAEMIFLGPNAQIPLGELAEKTSASVQEIGDSIQRLSMLGYPLNLRSDSVERLPIHTINRQELETSLRSQKIGLRIEWKLHVRSTQEEMKKLRQEAPDGTVLLAETQDSGKGRLARRWFSPLGGIWMSLLLKPSLSKSHQILPLALGAAVTRAIRATTGLSTCLKWPNDVIVRSRKVAGILSEATCEGDRLASIIVGVGVNANVRRATLPRELVRIATSLSHELGKDVNRNLLTLRTLEEMDKAYLVFEAGQGIELLNDVREVCSTIGREVEITTTEARYTGEAQEIGGNGQLIVRLRNGEMAQFYAGDVVHLRQESDLS